MTDKLFAANTESRERGYHNDDADAFRHAFFNALNTQSFGRRMAKRLGDAHEAVDEHEFKLNEMQMDKHNNEVGQDIGEANPKASPGAIAAKVEEQRKAGNLVVLADPENANVSSAIVPSNNVTKPVHLRPEPIPWDPHPPKIELNQCEADNTKLSATPLPSSSTPSSSTQNH
jgi:hypothetical protein